MTITAANATPPSPVSQRKKYPAPLRPAPSPPAQHKKYPAPQRPSIEELKKKYENQVVVETPKTSNSTVKKLKKKYESPTALEPPRNLKPKSPKAMKKSKVKQMASMFNTKISQIVGRDTEVGKYSSLVNDLSPEPKLQSKASLPKPLEMPEVHYTKQKIPVPSPRTKSKAKLQQNSICFVAEDVFAKLSVKDKAQLYTQFIEDMSKKNPKFGKHAELMEANVKKEVSQGEVVTEKQESVKYLCDELEARCAFPKQTISPWAEQRINSAKRSNGRFKTIATVTPVKSKEFEDIQFKKVSHVSTLMITLENESEIEQPRRARSLQRENEKPRRAKSLQRPRTKEDQLFKELGIIEPSHKRNNEEMRSFLPIEAYAPPKKIRRTRAERLSPNVFFQNQQLEHLFFAWLKDKHQTTETEVEITQQTEILEEKPKSVIDKLLEEAIAKLETVQTKQNGNLNKEENIIKETEKPIESSEKITPRKKNQAPAIPSHVLSRKSSTISESSTTSSTKHSAAEEESESGLSTLPKITSEESQTETLQRQAQSNEQDFDFVKPSKPLRKKKMRRTLTWKKELALVETNIIASTDSESECKISETKTKNKNLYMGPAKEAQKEEDEKEERKEEPISPEATKETSEEPSFAELDKTLMREVNSPSKIKTAYTLTVFSPSPTHTEEDTMDLDTTQFINREASRSWPSLVGNQINEDLTMETKAQSSDLADNQQLEPRNLADSFIDQGFETGSNEIDSPRRVPKKAGIKRQEKVTLPLFIKLESESRRGSIDPNCKIPENPSGFSTPIKGHLQKQQQEQKEDQQRKVQPQPAHPTTRTAQQQLFSPITLPLKNRRKSFYDSESRRNSLVMQVIREDHPLEHHEMVSPLNFSTTEQTFFANAPTLDITTDMSGINPDKTSQFWIKCGDFSISWDIFYNDSERVRLLYEIFSQKSCDSRELHFGIDDHKFSVHNPQDHENISKRLPARKDCSHYWFSTGDLAIPFAGKCLSSEKIQRIFQLIKATVEETGVLRFGVDEVEFSNVPEFWNQSPKFSMESNYSMLVGLQSGDSNGLEGRSKYAWPHTKPVMISDLDQSDFECEDFDENESGRLSFSPFSSNHFDLASLDNDDLARPRNSEAMMDPDSFYFDYENESLDQLFDPKYTQDHKSESAEIQNKSSAETQDSSPEDSTPVPKMLNSLHSQQQRLSLVKEKLSTFTDPFQMSSDALDILKGTPEYFERLKKVVADIKKIGSTTGFNNCSVQQLETYMFFLSRYADICLNSCSDHMEKVLDALLDQRAVEV